MTKKQLTECGKSTLVGVSVECGEQFVDFFEQADFQG